MGGRGIVENPGGGRSEGPCSSIIVNNSCSHPAHLSRCTSASPSLPSIAKILPSLLAPRLILRIPTNEEIPGSSVRREKDLKGREMYLYRQFSSIRASSPLSLPLCFSFPSPTSFPPPFLASSKIEIFHPSELICTDWLTSGEFPDRHVNPRGFGVQRLYEGASARTTHAYRLSRYKGKSCSEEVPWRLHSTYQSGLVACVYRRPYTFGAISTQRMAYSVRIIFLYRNVTRRTDNSPSRQVARSYQRYVRNTL